MTDVQLSVLVALGVLGAACHGVARHLRSVLVRTERRAGSPIGGLLDETAFTWLLPAERQLASLIGRRLTLVLALPLTRRWDRRQLSDVVRRNEQAVAVGDHSAAVLLWHENDRDLLLALRRIAAALERRDAMLDLGWAEVDSDDAGDVLHAAAARRRAVGLLADLEAPADATASVDPRP